MRSTTSRLKKIGLQWHRKPYSHDWMTHLCNQPHPTPRSPPKGSWEGTVEAAHRVVSHSDAILRYNAVWYLLVCPLTGIARTNVNILAQRSELPCTSLRLGCRVCARPNPIPTAPVHLHARQCVSCERVWSDNRRRERTCHAYLTAKWLGTWLGLG